MAIDYHFKNPALLEEALTHPSFSKGNSLNPKKLRFL
jgi:dsRNA-specific ribonuclease